ncbi:TPA: hypothetical protein EYP70_00310 [Candidatus Bathyarchaeota archaeon]|nr:hypothetical protein [Candidatus Bathyarchaeota archaeon]
MSEESPKIKDLLRRIDDILEVLKMISDDLREVSSSLRVMMYPTASTSLSGVLESRKLRTIDDVQRIFPRDLAGLLYFEETNDYILIKPRQYLGSENFAKIASIVRDQLGGEYISAGKDSHFRVSRKV